MKQHYFDNENQSHILKLQDIPLVGRHKRFNNMKRRLSLFFNMTKAEGIYADNRNSKGKFIPVFITLTYPTNNDWNPEDITNYIRKIKKYALTNWSLILRVAWVAETTKNGVIHYHLITWIPRTERLPMPSQPHISRGKTHKPMWKFRAKIEGVRKGVYGYMLKYISKGCELGGLGVSKVVETKKLAPYITYHKNSYSRINNDFSKSTFTLKSYYHFKFIKKTIYPRLFGYSGLSKGQRERLTYLMLPQYVKESLGYTRVGDNVRRVKGGFKVFKKNMVDKIYKYYSYCEPTILNNYEKLIYQDFRGEYYVDYIFGHKWSFIPEYNKTEEWFPF